MNSQNNDQLYMNYTEQGHTQNTNTLIEEDQKISVKSRHLTMFYFQWKMLVVKSKHLFYCSMIVIVVC